MPELEERFAEALHASAHAWRLKFDRRLRCLGLSQASWMTIAVAAKACTPLSQSELADRLGVESTAVVKKVDRLVKAKLVVREMSRTDRRVRQIILTEAGKRLYDSVRTVAAGVGKELLVDIDPKRLALATEFLETLQERLESCAP